MEKRKGKKNIIGMWVGRNNNNMGREKVYGE